MRPTPVSCKPGLRLDGVARLMVQHDCDAVPVCDENILLGIVTDHDIACRAIAKGKTPLATTAAEVMTTSVITIGEAADTIDAIDLMRKHEIEMLPVLDPSGAVIGTISLYDALSVVPSPAL